jgi:hypothetical protein
MTAAAAAAAAAAMSASHGVMPVELRDAAWAVEELLLEFVVCRYCCW